MKIRTAALNLSTSKLPSGCLEFHQVQRRQIARSVIQEEILRARVGRVLPSGAFAGVPTVDRGIELHSGIATDMRAFRNLPQQGSRILLFARLAV